jgi:hypothetical protein
LPLQIVEILGPSEQGQARPYKCRGDDGAIYFVKGRQTTRACLWHEWICGHLATSFGLPIPPFELVEVCEELLVEAPREWRDLGAGTAFGSRLHPNAVWMEPSWASSVPVTIQRDVLVFDWWIRNGDRLRGNPNLLWDASSRELVVIDHNLAFDQDFSNETFLELHMFAPQWSHIAGDLMVQAEYAARLCEALESLDTACDNAPPEWQWTGAEMDVQANFDLDRVKQTLRRCTTPELWRTV